MMKEVMKSLLIHGAGGVSSQGAVSRLSSSQKLSRVHDREEVSCSASPHASVKQWAIVCRWSGWAVGGRWLHATPTNA